MKIGFAARWNPLDKKSWSGTSYYTYNQIIKNNEVGIYHYTWPWRVREWLTMQKSLNRKFFNKQTAVEFLGDYAAYFSRQLQKDLAKRPVDVLFVSASPQLIAYLETKIPVIYMTDATFQQLQGYYPNFSNLADYNIRQGIELDKRAFAKTSHCMLASAWNKDSAIKDYGIDAGKISVVPCGANLDTIPSATGLNNNQTGQCRLLFLGVEWDRKGGEIALETFHLLKQRGINPQLHIIGCLPPHDLAGIENITVIPFLDKNNTEDFQRLNRIFLQTDFLLLPTRAECAGVVFSEASAYGIPSITTDTGGVGTYVKNGINGYMFSPEAGAHVYAEKIDSLMADRPALQNLKRDARKFYEENLDWEHWGTRFQQIARQLVQEKK